MLLKIVLVEDEPSAIRYLRSIIEMKCSGFEIVGTAENGLEGFEKVQALMPDIVITDIKMPVMDGIGLVSRIKEQYPGIYSIIVSGYQDFEYAKSAIQYGVVDYILKPINVGQLQSLLDSLRQKLEVEYYEKRVQLLKKVLHGIPIETWLVEKYLPFKRYSAAVLRGNGLPPRFSSKYALLPPASIEDTCIYLEGIGRDIWVLNGRDDLEHVFVYTSEIVSEKAFKDAVNEIAQKLGYSYHTIVFASRSFKLQDFGKITPGLYKMLDNNTVIGLCRTIYENSRVQSSVSAPSVLDGTLMKKIDFLVSNALYDELKQEFIKLFAEWEKEQRTQLWIEANLRQILHRIIKRSAAPKEAQNYNIEFLLDEALYYSTSFGNLLATVWELVESIVQRPENSNQKIDTPDFFNCIKRYMEENLSEPLSLQSVCSVFGISQTYLSRLFRKHGNMSFNEYLTEIRVDKAKRLIEENPDILLKDVASFVGYNDQFYFSRVFRSVTGVPPSEYIPET